MRIVGTVATALVLGLLLLLAACAAPERVTRESNLRTDPAQLRAPHTLVFLVPGALASTALFGPALDWGGNGVAVIEYRFPGFDGLPEDRTVNILVAAKTIAQVANRYPRARVRLIGFSTGAAIAIEAAARMPHEDVEVAAISSAVPFPGMLGAGPRGFLGLVRAAHAAGTLDAKEVWLEYFKVLLYGWHWDRDPATRARAEAIVEALRDQIVVPEDGVGRSHTANLLVWTLSREVREDPPRVRFYHGVNDTVVPLRLVKKLAHRLGARIMAFAPDAHLLLITRPALMERVGRDLDVLPGARPKGARALR